MPLDRTMDYCGTKSQKDAGIYYAPTLFTSKQLATKASAGGVKHSDSQSDVSFSIVVPKVVRVQA